MDRVNIPRKPDYVTINPEFNEVGTFNTFDRRLQEMDTSLSKVIVNSLRRKNELTNSVVRRNSEMDNHHYNNNKNEGRVEFPMPIQKNHHNLQSPQPLPISPTDTRWLSVQCEETHSPSYGKSPTASIRYREELHEAKYHSPSLQKYSPHANANANANTNTNIPTTPQSTQKSPLKKPFTPHDIPYTPHQNASPYREPSPSSIPLQPITAQVSETAQSTAPPEGFMLPLSYSEYISILAQRHQQSAGIVSKPPNEIDARLLPTSTNNNPKRKHKVKQQTTNTYSAPPVEYPLPSDPWERGYKH